MAKRVKGPALLVRVLTEVGAGRIWEVYLVDKHLIVEGETEGRSIRINPARHVVDTLIHETLHRLEPGWAESTVRRKTSWLLKHCFNDEMIEQLYVEYQRIAKKRKSRKKADGAIHPATN
jgi:hypothetical protein